jgi:carbonic anhydrase
MKKKKECSTIVSACSDYRIQKPLYEKLNELGILGDCDLSIRKGGCIEVNQKRHSLVEEVCFFYRNHEAKRLIIVTHNDCGAYEEIYNLSKMKDGAATEEKLQEYDAYLFEREVKLRCPGIEVIKAKAKINLATGKVTFEELTNKKED